MSLGILNFSVGGLFRWEIAANEVIIVLYKLFPGSYQRHRKPIWFYATEIDYGCDFLDNATYREM
jgi:hypothetical protein